MVGAILRANVLVRIADHTVHKLKGLLPWNWRAARRTTSGAARASLLTSAVFTNGNVAKLLSEDENWLYELSISMLSEDGCLRVYGVGEDGVTLHPPRIECL